MIRREGPGGGHAHIFLGQGHGRNERRVWIVIALTVAMMVVEILAGTIYGSMALVADGVHMSSHAAALLISAAAYRFARRHAENPRFTFGTGKVGDLAGFASAVILAVFALLIGYESLLRFAQPVPISFGQAIAVAALGLAANLASAWLLKDDHDHHHDHGHHGRSHHDHGHAAHHHHHHDDSHHDDDHSHAGHDHPPHRHEPVAHASSDRDNNLRSAYLHLLADVLTSVLAVAALALGSLYGWVWLDPAIGVLGALVIARWSYGLIRDTGGVLLDYVPEGEGLPDEIRAVVEADGDRITDLHVWQLGPGHHGAIVSLVTDRPMPPSHYREKLARLHELSHVTVEVEPREAA